jgi:hypothetical protein
MRILCDVIGGPRSGHYEDWNWPKSKGYPIRAWASATECFTVGKTFEAHCLATMAAMRGKSQGDVEAPQRHTYEVVSRDEDASVVRVRVEYRGARAEH